jgi:NADH-quinone oxidoreductase subunit K
VTPYLILGVAVFSIGVFGVLARRNLHIVLMSLELLLNGVNLMLAAFARVHAAAGAARGAADGQVFVLMVMAVAAAEVAVGLALVIALFRTRQTVDAADLTLLKG